MVPETFSQTLKLGSLRHWDEERKYWVVVQPGEPLFSLEQFLATEFLKLDEKGLAVWKKIHVD